MTSGWQRAPYFRRYGHGLVSKPAILLNEEKLGGLPCRMTHNIRRKIDNTEYYFCTIFVVYLLRHGIFHPVRQLYFAPNRFLGDVFKALYIDELLRGTN